MLYCNNCQNYFDNGVVYLDIDKGNLNVTEVYCEACANPGSNQSTKEEASQ